jgi:hypothetical protein
MYKARERGRRLTQTDGKNTADASECKLLLKLNISVCWTQLKYNYKRNAFF